LFKQILNEGGSLHLSPHVYGNVPSKCFKWLDEI